MMWANQRDIDATLSSLPRAQAAPAPHVFEGEWWSQFGANVRASATETWRTGLTISRENLFADFYESVLYELNQDQPAGRRFANPYRLPAISPFEGVEMQAAQAQAASAGIGQEQMVNDIWAAMDTARANNPGRYANLPKSRAELEEQVHARARESIDEAERVRAQSAPGAAFVGSLIGSIGPSLLDPVNIGTAFMGGGASSYLRLFLQETAAGALATTAALPEIATWRNELGRPMTAGEAGATVATGGLATGVLGVGGRFVHRNFVTPAWRSARATLDAIAQHEDVPGTVRTAARATDDELDIGETNPYGPTPEDEAAHAAALARAMRAIDDNAPAALPQLSDRVVRAADPEVQSATLEDGVALRAFKPDALETDAQMMQYKRGGDEAGVTDRLQGVTEWNPAFAGQVLVYETMQPRRLIVADGHQRLGLAKRLAAAGQDVTLYGVILREADGVTPEQARTIAALKNIAEGSGDALDAAAVLRLAPEGVTALPPRSPLVRQARALSRLSSDAWGMVWNGVAAERDAAIVGRLVDDPKLHAAILEYVSKAQAETLEEAELIVRQSLAAGARQEVQTDMFGAMLKADLILPERVRILKAALTSLRKDRGLFKTLVDRETRIAAEGNVLNVDANARALEQSARLFETIKALAERKGPISDALQAAAVRAKETGNRRASISDFVANVRSRVERGELDGEAPGGPIGAVDVAAARADGASGGQRAGGGDPVARGSEFSDPAGKPEAFEQQRRDLAMELGGEAMHRPKGPPIVRYREELKAIEARLPPVAEGSTRLWRGNRPGEVGLNPQFTNDAAGIAIPFRNAYGGPLSYVDVPTADLPKYVNKGAAAENAEFILPAELAARAKVVPELPTPFGNAADELRLFDALDPSERVPAIDGSGDELTIGELKERLEGEAKAVERLRVCATGEGG